MHRFASAPGMQAVRLAAVLSIQTIAALSLFLPTSAAEEHPTSLPEEPREIRLEDGSIPLIPIRGRSSSLLETAPTAGTGAVGRDQFESRPLLRPGELLEVVPGMVVTQHSGDGKANQYFFRGFNLDHGTDFRTVVDGMPVNMRTHGHGQGYTDLNFIIPELIDTVDYKKGISYLEEGDFATAGAAQFRLARRLQEGLAQLTVGDDDYTRGVLADSFTLGNGELLAGGEVFFYDGPWDEGNDVRKLNAALRYTLISGRSEFSLLALAYNNDWDATDQIAARAVEQDLISRLGTLDPDTGGKSNRYSLAASWQRDGADSRQHASLYGIYYDLNLFSNFTYFLDDPEHGDEFEQVDKRAIIGGEFGSRHDFDAFSLPQSLSYGLDYRSDFISEVGLHKTAGRRRLATVRDDEVEESSLGFYFGHEVRWLEKFRTIAGTRADLFWFDVEANTDGNSGSDFEAIASPKLNLIFGPWYNTELYLSSGYGFHSNDARGVTISVDPGSGDAIDPVDPLAEAKGFEIGLRTEAIEGLHSTIAFWALELESELVFVGDAGNTEASAESKRLGIEITNYYRPWSWLGLDLDYAFSRARFAEDTAAGDRIPGALEHVLTGGIELDSQPIYRRDDSLFAAFRVRYFAPYPLIEDNSTRAGDSFLANLRFGYRYTRFTAALEIFNLFDSDDRDIEYFYPSRLPGEPAEGIEDIHFHPLEPRQLRLTLAMRF